MRNLKDIFPKNGMTVFIVVLFHYPIINQLAYYAGSTNPYLWPWFGFVYGLPDDLVRYPSLSAWLFLVGIGLLLYAVGHFWRKDEIISFGLRLTGLVIVWFTLMFSVPIDVLKFLHSFNL